MSIETNRALVMRFYDLMSQLDFDTMFELMADDGTWTVAGSLAFCVTAGERPVRSPLDGACGQIGIL